MKNYKEIANEARKKLLQMVHKATTSHIGSNFSCINVMAVLFSKLHLDKDLAPDRDRFVLSKGWAAASLYYFLAEKGIISKEDLGYRFVLRRKEPPRQLKLTWWSQTSKMTSCRIGSL
jgi:transketolase